VKVSIQGIFYVAAHVSDLARSRQFYSERLGWKLETDGPTVAGLRFGAGYLVLLADHGSNAASSQPGGMHVAVQVSDIDSEHSRLAALGVPVSELRSQPWGERNFSFKDPDGYEWSYGEIKGDS
jgi:catechol 2,3-dioxygenase-like lactoylglutathione lyase family enzyme